MIWVWRQWDRLWYWKGSRTRKNGSVNWSQEETDRLFEKTTGNAEAVSITWGWREWLRHVQSVEQLSCTNRNFTFSSWNTTIQEWFQIQNENENFEGVHFNYIYSTLVTDADGFNRQFLLLTLLSQAVVVDISLPLRQATYLIEGDGPIALFLIDILARCQLSLSTCWETMDFPNIRYFVAANIEEEFMPPEPLAPLTKS